MSSKNNIRSASANGMDANEFSPNASAESGPFHGGGGGGGVSNRSSQSGLLNDEEVARIERENESGLTAVQIIEVFASRGIRFSEATFRKYVQQGLLPRSKRVGRKGKHRGSLGVYPTKTIRRINAIKGLMADGYTIEEIQNDFLRFTDVIESLEEGLSSLLKTFEQEAEGPRFDNRTRRSLQREIAEARQEAEELMARLEPLSRRISERKEERYRSTGAAGSAEDLL